MSLIGFLQEAGKERRVVHIKERVPTKSARKADPFAGPESFDTAKMGIGATRPLSELREEFELAEIRAEKTTEKLHRLAGKP